MGRWKARVERVTRRRKKRYCSIRGWAWRIAALVCLGEAEEGWLW